MQRATFYKLPKTSVFQQQLMVMMKKYKKSLFEISSVIHYWRFQIIESLKQYFTILIKQMSLTSSD